MKEGQINRDCNTEYQGLNILYAHVEFEEEARRVVVKHLMQHAKKLDYSVVLGQCRRFKTRGRFDQVGILEKAP